MCGGSARGKLESEGVESVILEGPKAWLEEQLLICWEGPLDFQPDDYYQLHKVFVGNRLPETAEPSATCSAFRRSNRADWP